MHIFTYGTLIFPEVWNAVVGRPFDSAGGTAAGYAIYRVRDAVFPGIIEASPRESVRGIVYLNVDQSSLDRLDRFEDAFYRRITITVDCDDGEQRMANAYVVPVEHRSVLTQEIWQSDKFVESGGLAEFIRRFEGFARLAANQ